MGRQKIMVVDDEERNLRLMEALLTPIGYDVILAKDGMEALKKVKERDPDLILLDIMMPKMDGLDVARRLKEDEKTRIIPIVMVTALKDVEDRVKALEVGADDFLSKPVDKLELRARVKSLLKVKTYNDHIRDYQNELEAEVERRTSQLLESLEKIKTVSLDTIHRLARAAEYKDEDTGKHIQRMSSYSALIASKMDVDNAFAESILYAAPMHDVGKIGIPDSILLKGGDLDSKEWETMKQHTFIGGRILEGSDTEVIKLAEVIALTHHEKWDGSGYPRGIKEKDIPIAGRITAIADVFDALTTERPYKKSISLEAAFNIIDNSCGSHFDPDVVEVFLSIKDEIKSIKDKYKDKSIPSLYQTTL